ncbi:MAG: polysaccharide biosynthesis C-terminal domain-containing protein [Bacteroidales bacterium]|nr:polysaccharide biosynthesis C-terminal domain-containing protein [Bacteroidales bacterium]
MKKRSLFKDITTVFASKVFAILMGLLLGIILARILGPQGKGIYTTLTVVPAIIVSFTTLGMRRTAVYFIGRENYDLSRIVSAVITILVFSSLIGILATLTVFILIDDPKFIPLYIGIITFILPFRLAVVYIAGIYIGRENFRFANMMKWTLPLINLTLVILLVWVLNLNIAGALLSLLLASLATSLMGFFKLSRDFTLRIAWDGVIIKKMIRLGILYASSLLVIKLIHRIDIILLEQLSDMKEVGYYSIAVNIAEKLWQLPVAMGVVVMSRTANEKVKGEMEQSLGRLLRLSLLAGVLGAVAIYFLAPLLIPLLYGKDFGPGSVMLQTILPGIILFIIFRLLNSRLSGLGKPMTAIYSVVPALVVNIILNIIWIPEYGGVGAAMATNVGYILAMILLLWRYTRISRTSIKTLLAPQKQDFVIVFNKVKTILKK